MTTRSAHERAQDPATPAAELATLAASNPELGSIIIDHPNAYDDLRNWIRLNGHASSPASSSPTLELSRSSVVLRALAIIGVATVLCAVLLTVFQLTRPVPASTYEGAPNQQVTVGDDTVIDSEEPAVEPSAAPPANPLLPTSCDQAYSTGYASGLRAAGFRNDTTVHATSPAGTADPTLAALIADLPRIECTWHPSNSDSTGIETSIIAVDASTKQSAESRFVQLNYAPLTELGGVRYFTEQVNPDGVPFGESHFIRDGVWFATRWIGYGPDGYTADIVGQVMGAR